MKTIEFNPTLTVTYTVDKCAIAELNGSHTEEFKLENLSAEDMIQYLAQCLIIKRQSMLRSKTADKIKVGVWEVPAPGKRISVDKVAKAKELLSNLTEEQKKAIAEAMGFTYNAPAPKSDEELAKELAEKAEEHSEEESEEHSEEEPKND